MSRKGVPSGISQVPGEVYTLHFWPPYGEPEGQQANHYTGWTHLGRVRARMGEHHRGRGARLTEIQVSAGGSFVLGRVVPGTKDQEHRAKYRAADRRCDVCKAERDLQAGRVTAGQALERAGWDRATDYERGLLLEIFGLEAAPENLTVRERQPDPEPITPQPLYRAATPEQTAEMDALVDELVAQWTADPKGPEAGPEPELEAG